MSVPLRISIFVAFLNSVTNYLTEATQGQRGSVPTCKLRPIMVKKAWWQEQRAAGHCTCSQKTAMEVGAQGLSPFLI